MRMDFILLDLELEGPPSTSTMDHWDRQADVVSMSKYRPLQLRYTPHQAAHRQTSRSRFRIAKQMSIESSRRDIFPHAH